jgi:hypothetical protein
MITRVFIPIIVDPDWNERNVRASCPGPDFVDDAGLQQGVHEFQAPPQPDVLAALLLELPDGGAEPSHSLR